MSIHIIREDITRISADAIVNPTNSMMIGTGGADGWIQAKAGIKLVDILKQMKPIKVGEAKITKGYDLPADYIIHTVGPVWKEGSEEEKALLVKCYQSCLKLAKKYNCQSIAFPLISSGSFGFPKKVAFQTALETIQEFLIENELNVYLVVYDKESVKVSRKLFNDIKEYIDDHYVEEIYKETTSLYPTQETRNKSDRYESFRPKQIEPDEEVIYEAASPMAFNFLDIQLDESFSECLIRLIDERNMKDSDCYKRANIDRKLFNKIKNTEGYHPKKQTTVALAISLELNLKETNDFISKAGYTLSDSFLFDVIIKYFIENKIYDVMLINQTLFEFDQPLLGYK